jgi:undecaprenyl-diphosphatase
MVFDAPVEWVGTRTELNTGLQDGHSGIPDASRVNESSASRLDHLRDRPRTGVPIWWVIPLLAGFICLAVAAHLAGHGTSLDHAVVGWMVQQRRPWLTTIAVAITTVGSPMSVELLAAVAAAVLWWRFRSPVPSAIVVVTVAVAAASAALLKDVVGAHRPPRTLQLGLETSPSFPSGHATCTLALLGILAVVLGRGRSPLSRRALTACVVVLTAAVALSRLYLGVHWLLDVVGGALLGGAVVLIGSFAPRPGTEGSAQHRPRREPRSTTVAAE